MKLATAVLFMVFTVTLALRRNSQKDNDKKK
jgi:hypothetical protein